MNRGISIIIVSYNVRHVLPVCLNSLRHSAESYAGDVDVIVVDNHSQDQTVSSLKTEFSEVNWVELTQNFGFGTACNIGVKQARHSTLLFLNPDTIVEQNTLTAIEKFFLKVPDAGIMGCKIKNRDNTLQLACRRSFPTPAIAFYRFIGFSRLFPRSRRFGRYNLTFLDENDINEVEAVSGSFMAMQRDVFESVGGFDEDFFMYGEDLDLCYRVKKAGRKNYYVPDTKIMHMKGESTKSRPFKSLFYFYQAMIIFSRKHFELRPVPLLLFVMGANLLAVANFGYNHWKKWPRWTLDVGLVNLVLLVVSWAYSVILGVNHIIKVNMHLYFTWHLLISLLIFFILGILGDYGKYHAKQRNIYLMTAIPFLAFFTIGYFFYEEAFSRIVFGVTGVLSYLALNLWRHLASMNKLMLNHLFTPKKRVVLIGEQNMVSRLGTMMIRGDLPGYEYLGTVEESTGIAKKIENGDFIGNLAGLPKLTKNLEIHEIIIAKQDSSYPLALNILSQKWNADIPVKILAGEPAPRLITLIEVNLTEK